MEVTCLSAAENERNMMTTLIAAVMTTPIAVEVTVTASMTNAAADTNMAARNDPLVTQNCHPSRPRHNG